MDFILGIGRDLLISPYFSPRKKRAAGGCSSSKSTSDARIPPKIFGFEHTTLDHIDIDILTSKLDLGGGTGLFWNFSLLSN